MTLNAEKAAAVYKLFARVPIRSDVVRGIMRGLVVTGLKHYYRSLKKEPPVLYKAIINDIAWSHKTYFSMVGDGSIDDL